MSSSSRSDTKNITKDRLVDICTRCSRLFNGHLKDFGIVEKCLLIVFDNLLTFESTIESFGYWHVVKNEVEILISLFLSMAYLGIAYSVIVLPSFIDPVAVIFSQNKCHQAVVREKSL